MTHSRHKHLPQILTPSEAASLIPDRSRVFVNGFASMGIAQSVIQALVDRKTREGSPHHLTLYHAAGHCSGLGGDALAKAGMIKKVVGGHWGIMSHLRQSISQNEIEAHNWPQGSVVRAVREMARGNRLGFESRVGLGTYIDPRDLGGCVNALSQSAGSLIRLRNGIDGNEFLHYSPLPIDFVMIRGWKADALGNIQAGMEPLQLTGLELALAARAQGGKVICQVRMHETEKCFATPEIMIPGFLIDYLVVSDSPEIHHRQSADFEMDPSLIGGDGQRSAVPLPSVPKGPRGWIGRRAAMEIQPGDVFNLGIGIPGEAVTPALEESGLLHEMTPTLESGMVGGVGLGGENFGITMYPQSRMDQGLMFDFYHGGGLDVAIMGAAEIGANGDINVSWFEERPTGCGGFIDITQNTHHVVFCSTFTAGSLEAVWAEGKLTIQKEGKHRKFVNKVKQITFSANQARRRGQHVVLITERCVFTLGTEGWILSEFAPGVDLQKDILGQLDFTPAISKDLKLMETAVFEPRDQSAGKREASLVAL